MKKGFTKIELLVVLGVLAGLVAFEFSTQAKAKARTRRFACVQQLKEMGLGYRLVSDPEGPIFTAENGGGLWQRTDKAIPLNAYSTIDPLKPFLAISNFVSPRVLACPSDARRPTTNWQSLTLSNVSYFTGPEANEFYPQTFLAGDRNLMTNGVRLPHGVVKIEAGANVSWDATQHRFQGNVATGDGSVMQLSQERLVKELANTGIKNTMLSIP